MKTLIPMLAATLLTLAALRCIADPPPPIRNYQNARAALQGAQAVARAGRGQILAVGGLMTDQSVSSNSLVILTRVEEPDIMPGMVLIMEKLDCPTAVCLLARRVTSIHGGIETEPYPSIEGILFRQVRATVLGVVAYSVELETNTIRDLQPGHPEESSFEKAIAQERGALTGALMPLAR